MKTPYFVNHDAVFLIIETLPLSEAAAVLSRERYILKLLCKLKSVVIFSWILNSSLTPDPREVTCRRQVSLYTEILVHTPISSFVQCHTLKIDRALTPYLLRETINMHCIMTYWNNVALLHTLIHNQNRYVLPWLS